MGDGAVAAKRRDLLKGSVLFLQKQGEHIKLNKFRIAQILVFYHVICYATLTLWLSSLLARSSILSETIFVDASILTCTDVGQ